MPDTRAGQDLDRASNTWGDAHDDSGGVVRDRFGGVVKTRFGKSKAAQPAPQWKLEAPPPQQNASMTPLGGLPQQGGTPDEPVVRPLDTTGQYARGFEGTPLTDTGQGMGGAQGMGGGSAEVVPTPGADVPGPEEYQNLLQQEGIGPVEDRMPQEDEEIFWQNIEKKMQEDPQGLLQLLKSVIAHLEGGQRSRVPQIMGSANLPRIG